MLSIGRDQAWQAARRFLRPSFMNCISALSRLQGTFEGAIERLRHLRETRNHARRTHAGRIEFSGRAELGLRWSRSVRAASCLRTARTDLKRLVNACHGARLARFARCGLQPSRARRELSEQLWAIFYRSLQHAVGRGRQSRRLGQRRSAALLLSTTRLCGCAIIISMAYVSMLFTPSSIAPRFTFLEQLASEVDAARSVTSAAASC